MFFFFFILWYINCMKKNKINLFFVFCALILGATCFFLPLTNNAIGVNAEIYQVVKKTGTTSTSASTFSVAYADREANITLKIAVPVGFEYGVGDTITYYYLNTELSAKYSLIPNKDPVVIGPLNINTTTSEISFAPSILGEPGTYKIMATIFDAFNQYLWTASSITFTIEKPENLQLSITYEIVNSQANALNTYKLTATLTYDNNPIDENAYEIRWYLANVENTIAFANRPSFDWTPTEVGTYTIRAEVDGLDEVVAGNNTLNISVVYDNTLTIILVVSAIALAMTAGVIISTVLKVKKERVW